MNQILEFLAGKKTYGVVILGLIYIAGAHAGWWAHDVDIEKAVVLALAFTLRSALHLHLPNESSPDGAQPAEPAKTTGSGAAVAAAFAFWMTLGVIGCGVLAACGTLKPGADALVVRAEQTEAIADSTFSFFLHLENDQREFSRTNAPELHQFAEFLRARQTIDGTNYARCDAMIVALNKVKRAYKADRSNSNLLVTATVTLTEALRQTSQFTPILTAKDGPTRTGQNAKAN